MMYDSRFQRRKNGWSLAEILLALLLTAMTTGGIFFVMSASSRNTMNAYHIYLAEQLAGEPLEVLRCTGFAEIAAKLDTGIGEYRFNRWQKFRPATDRAIIKRPAEAELFERKITAELIQHENTRGILLKVYVRPLTTAQRGLISRCETLNSGIIIERTP